MSCPYETLYDEMALPKAHNTFSTMFCGESGREGNGNASTQLLTTISREYARGRRERRNRFRPADVAFFSSESDKNVALIFRKIRCFNIHFNIHTCHRLELTSGEVQNAIRLVFTKNRYVLEDPSGKAADVFPRKIRGIR